MLATRREIKTHPVLYRRKVEQLLALSVLILDILQLKAGKVTRHTF